MPAGSFQAFSDNGKVVRPRVILSEISNNEDARKVGSLFLDEGGRLYRRVSNGSAERVEVKQTTLDRIRGMLSIRDALIKLLELERSDAATEEIGHWRKVLTERYMDFVYVPQRSTNTPVLVYRTRFGPLSSRTNQAALAGDPDLPLLLSLERNYNEATMTADRAAIFFERVIMPAAALDHVDSPEEALHVVLNEVGHIDWARMSELTGQSVIQLQGLLNGALVFKDPQSGEWVTSDDYLSGRVRTKLREARARALVDSSVSVNVSALERVIPDDIPPSQIAATPGVTWVPLRIYSDFAQHVLNARQAVRVRYIGGEYLIADPYTGSTKWDTASAKGYQILIDTINLRRSKVYNRVGDKYVIDRDETLAAREKQKQLAEYFQTWLFSEDKRTDQLVRIYNDQVNDLRLRTFDGSHLTLPGMSRACLRDGDLEPYQKAAVWRQICQRNVYLAHCVGAGKTFMLIAAAMELKRLGLIRRPMFVVPNNTLSGWQDQFADLYPGKRVITLMERDLERGRRQALLARIATSDWDAVIIPHSSFKLIPVGDEIFEQHFQRLANQLQESIDLAEGEGMDTRFVKRLEKQKEKLLKSLEERRAKEKKDQTITWEDLAIEQLYVDEAHMYRRLGFTTKQGQIAGIDPGGNQATFDLLMKVRYTQQHARGVTYASGTPCTNTMGELYNIMAYLIEDELDARGLGRFDEWAAAFGRVKDVFEPKPEGGGYQLKPRFSKFVNIPELAQLFRSFADVLTSDMLDIPRPDLYDGERRPVVNELNEAQVKYMERLQDRAGFIRQSPADALPDNMCAIYGDAQKMALDVRMVKYSAPDYPDSRINQAADEIFATWQRSARFRGTQLVFCDFGKPSSAGTQCAFSVYDELTRKLIERGIPPQDIAHIYEARNKMQRADLFRRVNAGQIRVLLGSTGKLGIGVNVQERVIAMHHLTLPHRPSDLEQREGRGLRQGNLNPYVHSLYYITKNSLDELKFANVARKARAFAQFMQGKSTVREMEDVEDLAPSLEAFQAAASGDPRVIRKLEVDNELLRLSALHSAWRDEQWTRRARLQSAIKTIDISTRLIADYEAMIASRDQIGRVWIVNGETIPDGTGSQSAAIKALSPLLRKARAAKGDLEVTLGTAYGITLKTDGAFVQLNSCINTIDIREVGPAGVLGRVENSIVKLESRIEFERGRIERAEKDRDSQRAALNESWPNQALFDSLVAEQARLMKQLGGNDDPTAMGADDDEFVANATVEAVETTTQEDDEKESQQQEEILCA